MLYRCQENSGLIQRDKDEIQANINHSHPEILNWGDETPNLTKILKLLGVKGENNA